MFLENQTRLSKSLLALRFMFGGGAGIIFKFQLKTPLGKHSLTNLIRYPAQGALQFRNSVATEVIISRLTYRWSRVKTLDVKR